MPTYCWGTARKTASEGFGAFGHFLDCIAWDFFLTRA